MSIQIINQNNPFDDPYNQQVTLLKEFYDFAVELGNEQAKKVISAYMWIKVNEAQIKSCFDIYMNDKGKKVANVRNIGALGSGAGIPLHFESFRAAAECWSALDNAIKSVEGAIQTGKEHACLTDLLDTLGVGCCIESHTRSILYYAIAKFEQVPPKVNDLFAREQKDDLQEFLRGMMKHIGLPAIENLEDVKISHPAEGKEKEEKNILQKKITMTAGTTVSLSINAKPLTFARVVQGFENLLLEEEDKLKFKHLIEKEEKPSVEQVAQMLFAFRQYLTEVKKGLVKDRIAKSFAAIDMNNPPQVKTIIAFLSNEEIEVAAIGFAALWRWDLLLALLEISPPTLKFTYSDANAEATVLHKVIDAITHNRDDKAILVMKKLIARRVNPLSTNNLGWSPLSTAIWANRKDLYEQLAYNPEEQYGEALCQLAQIGQWVAVGRLVMSGKAIQIPGYAVENLFKQFLSFNKPQWLDSYLKQYLSRDKTKIATQLPNFQATIFAALRAFLSFSLWANIKSFIKNIELMDKRQLRSLPIDIKVHIIQKMIEHQEFGLLAQEPFFKEMCPDLVALVNFLVERPRLQEKEKNAVFSIIDRLTVAKIIEINKSILSASGTVVSIIRQSNRWDILSCLLSFSGIIVKREYHEPISEIFLETTLTQETTEALMRFMPEFFSIFLRWHQDSYSAEDLKVLYQQLKNYRDVKCLDFHVALMLMLARCNPTQEVLNEIQWSPELRTEIFITILEHHFDAAKAILAMPFTITYGSKKQQIAIMNEIIAKGDAECIRLFLKRIDSLAMAYSVLIKLINAKKYAEAHDFLHGGHDFDPFVLSECDAWLWHSHDVLDDVLEGQADALILFIALVEKGLDPSVTDVADENRLTIFDRAVQASRLDLVEILLKNNKYPRASLTEVNAMGRTLQEQLLSLPASLVEEAKQASSHANSRKRPASDLQSVSLFNPLSDTKRARAEDTKPEAKDNVVSMQPGPERGV